MHMEYTLLHHNLETQTFEIHCVKNCQQLSTRKLDWKVGSIHLATTMLGCGTTMRVPLGVSLTQQYWVAKKLTFCIEVSPNNVNPVIGFSAMVKKCFPFAVTGIGFSGVVGPIPSAVACPKAPRTKVSWPELQMFTSSSRQSEGPDCVFNCPFHSSSPAKGKTKGDTC